MEKQKRLALCFSGHIRDFNLCYESLNKNFIQPLLDNGFTVDTFGVFWNVLGHRSNGWQGNPDFALFEEKLKPKVLIIEPFDRMKFLNNFTTDQWMKRPHLSCVTTSGDAACMWYGIYKCFQVMEKYQTDNNFKYDIICRVRADLLFDTQVDINELDDIMNRDIIYMPKWRGKYYEVCHEITDYFGMGNYNVMKTYMSTYTNIPNYITSDKYIHTAEGYLLAQIKDILIKRTNIQFSLQRVGYIENVMC